MLEAERLVFANLNCPKRHAQRIGMTSLKSAREKRPGDPSATEAYQAFSGRLLPCREMVSPSIAYSLHVVEHRFFELFEIVRRKPVIRYHFW